MQTFQIQLTRYANGRREISDVEHVQADDFADAHRLAHVMCRAAHAADGKDYEIVSILNTGYHGHRCANKGGGMWERNEPPPAD